MNEAPEIVCDVLFYLSAYVHHRTNHMPYETYKNVLFSQVQNTDIRTKEQIQCYKDFGWQSDHLGIDANRRELRDFYKNFRHMRDAKPTEDEVLKSQMRVI